MHFDLSDLRLFVHIAEAESITGGARRAHISTPAVSTRIKDLEGQLGSRLLYRSSKGVQLTPAGEKFLRHARGILRQVDFLKMIFQNMVARTLATSEFSLILPLLLISCRRSCHAF